MNAIDLLVTGSSDKEVADKVGVDRSTVTRWRNYHPAFIAELNVQREALWGTAKEKLRSLMPEAVDVVAEAIRDNENPNRVKVAIELLRSVKMSETVSNIPRTIEADAVLESWTRDHHSFHIEVPYYQIEDEELNLQAKVRGLSVGELISLAEEHEKEERRAKREAKKAEKLKVENRPENALPAQEADTMPTGETQSTDISSGEKEEMEEPQRYDPLIYEVEKRAKSSAVIGPNPPDFVDLLSNNAPIKEKCPKLTEEKAYQRFDLGVIHSI